ncbi:MAG: hypothetical protein ACRDZM_08525, partial [Acidimicrobiia bacterium]
DAVRSAIRDHGEDPLARAAARLSRSSSGRLWKPAYARSTDRFAALSRFVASHPALVEAVLATQRRRVDRDRGQDLVLGWILNLMARYQLATERAVPGWLVIDEGFAQRGVALFASGFDDVSDSDSLDRYLDTMPRPDLVVVVDTPLEVCEQRLDHRGWSERARELDPATRRRFLTDAGTVTRLVATGLEQRDARLIWVDGTTPIQDSLPLVAATLTP